MRIMCKSALHHPPRLFGILEPCRDASLGSQPSTVTTAGGLFTGDKHISAPPESIAAGFSVNPPLPEVQTVHALTWQLSYALIPQKWLIACSESCHAARQQPNRRKPTTVRRKEPNWGYGWGYFPRHSTENGIISGRCRALVDPSSATVPMLPDGSAAVHGHRNSEQLCL